MNFNELNSHERDLHIHFVPENHSYTVRGVEYLSVTTFIHRFFPQFDAPYWASRKAPRLGKTPEELLEEWRRKGEAASAQGTLLHENIENFLLQRPHGTQGAFPLFLKFLRENPELLPYRTEWKVYDEEHRISGTIDLVESHEGVFDMYDWKCSCKLLSERGEVVVQNYFREMAFRPIQHLDNTLYQHYALQQSLYRYILEKHYGLVLRSCNLVVLHPDYKDYRVIRLPYLFKEVADLLAIRKREVSLVKETI